MATVVQTKDKKIKLSNGGWAKFKTKLPMSVQYNAAIEAKEKHPKNADYMAGIYLLAGLITEWDLVDEKGKTVPINVKTVDTYLTDKDTYKIIGHLQKAKKLTTQKKSK